MLPEQKQEELEEQRLQKSELCGIIPSMEYMNPQLKNEYSKPTPRAIFRLHQTTMVDYSYYQFHTPQSWAPQRCCRHHHHHQ